MDLNFEYNQDLVIEGKPCVLNFVENIEKADHYLIRRHFISADGKFKTHFDKLVTKAAKPAAQQPATSGSQQPLSPAPSQKLAANAPVPKTWVEPPAEEKRGIFSRAFGGGKKKGKK